MAILSIQFGATGLAGVLPNTAYINTADTVATITGAGYLNGAHAEGFAFSPEIAALVYSTDAGVHWYKTVVTGTAGAYVYSLAAI